MTNATVRWLGEAPPSWDALLRADPGATAAHRPELWRAFASVQPGHSLRFAAVEDADGLAGGVPVLVQRRAGLSWLHALPMLLPAAPLARAGAHAWVDAAAAQAIGELAAAERAVGGTWSLYRASGQPVDPASLAAVGGATRWFEAAVVELAGGIEAAARGGSRKARQSLQQARRRPLAFREEPGALEEVYALHAAQSRAWSRHRLLPLELSRALLRAPAQAPAARLFTLRDRSGVLSGALALDGPHETLVWWSGTHPAGRRSQAFTLLLWSIAEWAAGAGRTRVNLGASAGLEGVAAFKQALGARSVRYPVRVIDERHAPPPGRWVARLQARLRRGAPAREPA